MAKKDTYEHFVVTNREVTTHPKNKKKGMYIEVNDEEYIRTDGRELSSYNLRFGTYRFTDMDDGGKLEIYPEPDEEGLQGAKDSALPSN